MHNLSAEFSVIFSLLATDLLGELIASHRLRGSLSGNKTTYTPDVYLAAQSDWVKNFYTQNSYLGTALVTLTISSVTLTNSYSSGTLTNKNSSVQYAPHCFL